MKPPVKEIFYESQADAFKRVQGAVQGDAPLAEQATERAFADSFEVSLTDAGKYDVIVSSFQGAPGVGRVQDQKQLLDRFFAFMNAVSWGAIALSALMVLCAILLMATTIRQTAFSRRRKDRDHAPGGGLQRDDPAAVRLGNPRYRRSWEPRWRWVCCG